MGVDVGIRSETRIPVARYDGWHLPFGHKTFDAVILVDVLHHTDDPGRVLAECLHVSTQCVVIKDHFYRNPVEHAILRPMDWVGNAPHGVRLPYSYFTRTEWQQHVSACGAGCGIMAP